MKILEHGNRYQNKKQFLCTSCWCKFEADYEEYRDATRKDGFTLTHYFACKCPECGCEAGSIKD